MSGNSTELKPLDFSSIARRTRRTAFGALAVATLMALIGLGTLFEMRHSSQQVAHTNTVLDAINRVVIDVRDATASAQAYSITGDSVFMRTYWRGRGRIGPDMGRLRTLVSDNERQLRRVNLMDSIIAQRKDLLDDQLYVQRTFGSDSAVNFIRTGTGFALMRQMQRVAQGAQEEERELLASRAARLDRDLWLTVIMTVVGFACAVYLVSKTNARLLRALRARERAEDEAIHARQNAEAANLAKSNFLARMSHELRTPLNSVIGFANVMKKNKDGRLTEGDITYLDRIQANGRHLLSLINQILDLSKIEAGRVELIIEPVDISSLVQEVVAQFEPQAREIGLVLQVDAPVDIPTTNIDSEKVRQILINLVGNAMKFTQSGGVTVSVRAKRGVVAAIDVRDTGIGIPTDRLSAVFEAFEQVDTSTTRRFGGTGLGLSISRSLAQLMGLELTVDSTLGVGTTFTLLFPASTQKQTPSRGTRTDEWRTPAAVDGALLHDRLVLVIDDNADARTLVARHLEDMGCRVIAATNGEQGLRVANRFTPDVIMLDIQMPDVDGWEVLRRLNADPALQNTPVIIVSVIATEHPEQAPPGVLLLDKPFTRDDLAVALTHVLHAQRQMT